MGTGGEGHHGLATTLPTSLVRTDQTFGILKLTLHETTYDWVFLSSDGSTFTDSGTQNVHSAPTMGDVTVTFRDGENGYTGTVDTYLRAAQPTTPHGANPELQWDQDEGTGQGPQFTLIRFDSIFGADGGTVSRRSHYYLGDSVVHGL